MNYKFEICYEGSRYYGWERQPGKATIQGKLESVLAEMAGRSVELIGAGRTDAGVHAKAMIANAHLDTALSCDQIRDYMNRYLPDDIAVRRVQEASERFHARYNAVGKTYVYTCYIGATKPVFNRRTVTRLDFQPDVEAMQTAAAALVGEHDFRSFCSNPNMKKSTVRRVDRIEITRRKDFVTFRYHGTGFLQHMVRILTGTLLEVGAGRLEAAALPSILEARDRTKAGPTAPAGGLCLESVDY